MTKLRRHDWRSHREIECSTCGEMLESREDIPNHRQRVHGMFRKMPCRYYPDCYDENECLFDHKSNAGSYCPNGLGCSDQSCTFSEQNHKNIIKPLCRYQANCNRLGCLFKHNVSRRAFLGGSQGNQRRF